MNENSQQIGYNDGIISCYTSAADWLLRAASSAPTNQRALRRKFIQHGRFRSADGCHCNGGRYKSHKGLFQSEVTHRWQRRWFDSIVSQIAGVYFFTHVSNERFQNPLKTMTLLRTSQQDDQT